MRLARLFAVIAACCAQIALPSHAHATGSERDLLLLQQVVTGGFSDAVPNDRRAAGGRYIKLTHPASLAASGRDLYVADIGQGLLLRIDLFTSTVTPLRDLPPLPATRLAAGLDGSVYLVRPGRMGVERIGREGQSVSLSETGFDLRPPTDAAIGPSGQLWLSNGSDNLFVMHPSGRMGHVIAAARGTHDAVGGVTLLAVGRLDAYGYDPICRCVLALDRDGRLSGTFAHGELLSPIAMRVDIHDRLWVLDRGDRKLKVYAHDTLVGEISPERLGMLDITGMALHANQAFLADGPGGKIAVFILPPPSSRR